VPVSPELQDAVVSGGEARHAAPPGARGTRQVVYLHGFASSARSAKATWFADRLRGEGVACHCPDLNLPSFETLTVSRMLVQVGELLDGLPAVPTALIGSSLGGLVAWHLAARRPSIERVVLLAPALDVASSLSAALGSTLVAEWKSMGSLPVFHFGQGQFTRVHYGLIEDATQYDPARVRVDQPVLAWQGRRDVVVPAAGVERFCATRHNVRLELLDDDHQLLKSLDAIWAGTRIFLGLGDRP
jgi:pimeloyl-ACP methyl ester carboxylesterase